MAEKEWKGGGAEKEMEGREGMVNKERISRESGNRKGKE